MIRGDSFSRAFTLDSKYESADWEVKAAVADSGGTRLDKDLAVTDGSWKFELSPDETESLIGTYDLQVWAQTVDADGNVTARETVYRSRGSQIEESLSDASIVRAHQSRDEALLSALEAELEKRKSDFSTSVSGSFGSLSFESREAMQRQRDQLRVTVARDRELMRRADRRISGESEFTVTY